MLFLSEVEVDVKDTHLAKLIWAKIHHLMDFVCFLYKHSKDNQQNDDPLWSATVELRKAIIVFNNTWSSRRLAGLYTF